jgi:alpha-glucoside transport system substrate-binding protein
VTRRSTAVAAVVSAAVLGLAACGCSTGGGALAGQTLDVAGVWSGDEQQAFEEVMHLFERQTGATVDYTSAGDDLPTVLETKVQGHNPPNVAFLPQPVLITQFERAGALKPLPPDVVQALDQHYAPMWRQLTTVDDKVYGVYFKIANKSTVWYSPNAFDTAGVSAPATFDELTSAAGTLADSGIGPISVGAADGWVLTDWFENIYLRSAGAEKYDELSRHQIPWTDSSVTTALTLMTKVLSETNLAGGVSGALQTDFSTSVTAVFGQRRRAAMVYEGDFVRGVITAGTKAKLGEGAKVFPFPSVAGSGPAVTAGGDAAVAFKDDKATMALMRFLTTPEAAAVWARHGGFLSPNKQVGAGAYPDAVSRDIAGQLSSVGDNVRFDMSDMAPAAFGATKGSGEWRDLQDLLAHPDDVWGAAVRLEADAGKAFGS